MFCKECGSKLSDTEKFCHNCGSRIERKKILLCQQCKGHLEYDPDSPILFCPFCGSKELIEESDTVKIARMQLKNDYEKQKDLAEIEKEKVQASVQKEAINAGKDVGIKVVEGIAGAGAYAKEIADDIVKLQENKNVQEKQNDDSREIIAEKDNEIKDITEKLNSAKDKTQKLEKELESSKSEINKLKEDLNKKDELNQSRQTSPQKSIKFIPLICPNCGASIKVSSEEKNAVCANCGTSFLVDDGISESEKIQNNIINGGKKIKINQFNTKDTFKHLDNISKRNHEWLSQLYSPERMKRMYIYCGASLAFMAVLALIVFGISGLYNIGKREVPISSEKAIGENCSIVYDQFIDAGFENVSLVDIDEQDNDKVEKITIDGRDYFLSGATFKKGATIKIYY